jgi:hypothetical protein
MKEAYASYSHINNAKSQLIQNYVLEIIGVIIEDLFDALEN